MLLILALKLQNYIEILLIGFPQLLGVLMKYFVTLLSLTFLMACATDSPRVSKCKEECDNRVNARNNQVGQCKNLCEKYQ